MSHYYFNPAPPNSLHMAGAQAPFSSHQPHHNNHHHPNNRSRKGPRFSSGSSQNSAKHFKPHLRATRESAEAAQLATTRKDFEAARSFDLEDDEVFCPWHLLTEDDLHSIHSASSDRSSSSSTGSPDTSPLQPQLQPTPSFAFSGAALPHVPGGNANPLQSSNSSHLKIHQPLAQRTRNAIPIVDPNSRNTSPPESVSPNRQAQKPFVSRRW